MSKIPPPLYNNSGGRLLAILKSIPVGSQLGYKQWIGNLYPEVLAVEGASRGKQLSARTVHAKLREFDEVFIQYWEDLDSCPRLDDLQKNLFKKGTESLSQLFAPEGIDRAIRPPTEAELSNLNIACTFLPRENDLEKDDVEKVRQQIADLGKMVKSGKLSPTLRKSLLEIIALARKSLETYEIHGARGLKEQFRSMLGEACLLWTEVGGVDTITEEEDKEAMRGIASILGTMEGIVVRLGQWQPGLQLLVESVPFLKLAAKGAAQAL